MKANTVTFLNPKTCGIYKNGGVRFKTDRSTGLRTTEIDNELISAVDDYLKSCPSFGQVQIPLSEVFEKKVLVPTYFDDRFNQGIKDLLEAHQTEGVSIQELLKDNIISIRGGHGSPGNDQRLGSIPYVKVSDIRGLRINVNPTNLVSTKIANRFWRGQDSGLKSWDLITPNRASSNIGEFAILLPGEENVVLTKEVFVFRIIDADIWDPFYLLWALSLKVVREQWRRIALMQTNREDCGSRYKEIILPKPKNAKWAKEVSKGFREYFQTLANAKTQFIDKIKSDKFEYVANVISGQYQDEEIEIIENDEDQK